MEVFCVLESCNHLQEGTSSSGARGVEMIRVAAVVVAWGQQGEQKGIVWYTWFNSVEMGCVGVHDRMLPVWSYTSGVNYCH